MNRVPSQALNKEFNRDIQSYYYRDNPRLATEAELLDFELDVDFIDFTEIDLAKLPRFGLEMNHWIAINIFEIPKDYLDNPYLCYPMYSEKITGGERVMDKLKKQPEFEKILTKFLDRYRPDWRKYPSQASALHPYLICVIAFISWLKKTPEYPTNL